MTWALEKLRRGEPMHVVDDVFENPIYNIQCGEALWKIVEQKPSGIIHLAGGERVNRHQFLQTVAEVFSLDKDLLQPVPSSFFKTIARRPADTTFVVERMTSELGITPLTIREGLNRMKQEADLDQSTP